MSDLSRIIQLALRVTLAAAFLSAVADRFGWWGAFGEGTVAWGDLGHFAATTHLLVPFVSGWLLTALVWVVTTLEIAIGILLLMGWWPKLVGAASCVLLVIFATAMALSPWTVESPLSYSVLSGASASAAYALLAGGGSKAWFERRPRMSPDAPAAAIRG